MIVLNTSFLVTSEPQGSILAKVCDEFTFQNVFFWVVRRICHSKVQKWPESWKTLRFWSDLCVSLSSPTNFRPCHKLAHLKCWAQHQDLWFSFVIGFIQTARKQRSYNVYSSLVSQSLNRSWRSSSRVRLEATWSARQVTISMWKGSGLWFAAERIWLHFATDGTGSPQILASLSTRGAGFHRESRR